MEWKKQREEEGWGVILFAKMHLMKGILQTSVTYTVGIYIKVQREK